MVFDGLAARLTPWSVVVDGEACKSTARRKSTKCMTAGALGMFVSSNAEPHDEGETAWPEEGC